MKIKKINIKNINSLKGNFEIDFDKFLKNEGLFCITGPTGAGKSTILDTITCALYGRTPRLSNPNDLMSKNSGECYCEVEFEIKDELYHSSWSLHRARNKPDGAIQPAKMELSNIKTNKIIASGLKKVPKEIEKITGLDFERFIKSMMLAQGGFDAFLKANENERSALLEKMTGTQIYKLISQEVYDTYSIKKKEIDDIKLLIDSQEDIDENSIKIKRENLIKYKSSKEELDKKANELLAISTWLENIEKLKLQNVEYDKKFQEIQKLKETKKDDFAKLELALKASNVELVYKEQSILQTNITKDEKELYNLNKTFLDLQKKLAIQTKIDTDIKKQYDIAKADFEQQRKNIEEKKILLSNISSIKQNIKNIQKHNKIIENSKEKLEVLKEQIAQKDKLIATIKGYLSSLYKQKENELLISKYTKDREKLEDGKPCFLCGSTTHPYINNLDIKLDKTEELIKTNEEKLQIETNTLKKLELSLSKNSTKYEQSLQELKQLQNCNQDIEKLKELEAKSTHILNIEDINQFEKDITKKFEKITKDFYSSKELLNSLNIQIKSIEDQIVAKSQQLTEDKNYIKTLTKRLNTLLKENGFDTIDMFLEALLDQKDKDDLSKSCKDIEDKFNKIFTLKQKVQKELDNQIKLNKSDKKLEDIKQEYQELQIKIDSTQSDIGSLKKELEILEKTLEKNRKYLQDLEKKNKDIEVWIKLNDLIGSAKGDKFSKFAQGITLNRLVFLANQHLNRLSSRYTLKKDDLNSLNLEIIDGYQGDIIRPISTLSGGESFIVSLALALGLSTLASANISIDSLFLDEGFGSLDDNSLDKALDALAQLQSSGKMIGVISHVEALKERILLQLKVEPKGDGTSILVQG